MLGQEEFELEAGQHHAADESGDQQQRHHGRKHEEQEIVSGEERTRASEHQSEDEQRPAARDAVANAPAKDRAKAGKLQDRLSRAMMSRSDWRSARRRKFPNLKRTDKDRNETVAQA